MEACPVCEQSDSSVLFEITSQEAAQHFVPREGEPGRHAELALSIERLWLGTKACVRECRECGFGFVSPHVAGDENFYRLAFGQSGYPRNRWEFRKTANAIRSLSLNGGQCLEIGAGNGHFLSRVSPSIFDAKAVTAIEYNEHSRRTLMEAGYSVRADTIDALASEERKYDAIFMFQVLEHMDKPRHVFAVLKRILRPGGHIFIAVPNSARTKFQERSGSLLDMPPNHIGRWTLPAFDRIAKANSFSVVEWEIEDYRPFEAIKTDMVFSYMRRAQKPGSLPNKFYHQRKESIGRMLNVAVLGAFSVSRIPTWLKAFRRRDELGASLWIHLKSDELDT